MLARLFVVIAVFVFAVAPQGQQSVFETPRTIQGNASPDPLLAPFRFRNIGPASMGGRIDDIEAAPSDSSIIYIGYASIGDIAIHPTNPNIVYVGTGEANNRQTSSFGDGIYKTTDGGRTWNHVKFIDEDTSCSPVPRPGKAAGPAGQGAREGRGARAAGEAAAAALPPSSPAPTSSR